MSYLSDKLSEFPGLFEIIHSDYHDHKDSDNRIHVVEIDVEKLIVFLKGYSHKL